MQTNYMTKRHKFSFYENVVALKIPQGDVKSWHVCIISSAATKHIYMYVYKWFMVFVVCLFLDVNMCLRVFSHAHAH